MRSVRGDSLRRRSMSIAALAALAVCMIGTYSSAKVKYTRPGEAKLQSSILSSAIKELAEEASSRLSPVDSASVYLTDGASRLVDEDSELAIEKLDLAIQLHPELQDAYILRGYAHLMNLDLKHLFGRSPMQNMERYTNRAIV